MMQVALDFTVQNTSLFKRFVFLSAWKDDRLRFEKGEEITMNQSPLNRERDLESSYYYAGSFIPKAILQPPQQKL